VQRYVENPLVVQNKKFDIRLYIVIKGVDPIEAYLFEEGLARFCTVSSLDHIFETLISHLLFFGESVVKPYFDSKTIRNLTV